MVHRVITSALCAMALLAKAHADLDLTPFEHKVDFEGVPVAQTAFHNGNDVVLYSPPPGWTVQGSGSKAELRTAAVSLAAGSIEWRKRVANAAPDNAQLEKLRAEMTACLPREAQAVTWEAPEENPVLLNQHETRRLTVSYSAFAQHFTSTLVVCNFAQQQIIFRLDCRTDDFPKQYDLFRRSLFTWQGLP